MNGQSTGNHMVMMADKVCKAPYMVGKTASPGSLKTNTDKIFIDAGLPSQPPGHGHATMFTLSRDASVLPGYAILGFDCLGDGVDTLFRYCTVRTVTSNDI
eukprot:6488498-Amphidinium_carterae.1